MPSGIEFLRSVVYQAKWLILAEQFGVDSLLRCSIEVERYVVISESIGEFLGFKSLVLGFKVAVLDVFRIIELISLFELSECPVSLVPVSLSAIPIHCTFDSVSCDVIVVHLSVANK